MYMIFLASVEVKPLPKSQLNAHGVGALIYCLVPADSRGIARKKLGQALRDDMYQIVKIEFIENYTDYKWDDKKDQLQYDRLAKRAALNDDIVYGPFYTWQQEDI